VSVRGLHFRYRRFGLRAPADEGDWVLQDLDLDVETGETLGIIGESGSGKSTLVRILCGLLPMMVGEAEFDGRPIQDWIRHDPAEFRKRNQMVFQSPANSLDPRMRVKASLAEPVKATDGRAPSDQELAAWLEQVGLGPEVLPRYPHQLSGGQLQRVAIARALSLGPRVLYADEPTSALDVSVQAQILNLLLQLRRDLGLTLVMVSHDLAVISRLCERMIVMKDGLIVEAGRTVDILMDPGTDYTAQLISAAASVSLRTR
jgi:ABC-type glutathione transport system ATPase component